MYPYERYYNGLKSYVRNLAKPKGSMAASHELEEAAGYVTEYMSNYTSTCMRVWDSQEDPTMTDEILKGRGIPRMLTEDRRQLFHNFVIDTSGYFEEHRERYKNLKEDRDEQRRIWRRQHPHRKGGRGVPFPENLCVLPSFANWLEDDVQLALASGVELSDIIKDVSIPPKFECKKFRSMWAFGSRFRVASYEKRLGTHDSGMAATFTRQWRSSARDQNLIEADVEYVGELEEIVELDYRTSCVVVFVCRWVRANYRGENATIKKDKWGFTLANFCNCEGFGKESFAFPKHCQQIFFSDTPELPGWKVVLRREVRGRRVYNLMEESENPLLFDRGRDCEYEGLRPPDIISEDMHDRAVTSRELRRQDIFQEAAGEEEFFDRDLGESSHSE